MLNTKVSKFSKWVNPLLNYSVSTYPKYVDSRESCKCINYGNLPKASSKLFAPLAPIAFYLKSNSKEVN